MNTYYNVDSGVISVFMYREFLENDGSRGVAFVRPIKNGKMSHEETRKPLYKDEKGLYISWNHKRVYLNDFNYMPYETLIKEIEKGIALNDRWYVWDDAIWATFMKEFEKVSIVCEMPVYDALIPQMGIGMVSDKTMPVVCKLSEGVYKRNEMDYKLTLTCKDEALHGVVASQSYYFSDFCSMLKSGMFKLVPEDFIFTTDENKVNSFRDKICCFFKKG